MEKKFRFKTTLKCSGCVSKVTPFLNSLRDVTEWSVDLQHPDKVLTVMLKTGDTHSVEERRSRTRGIKLKSSDRRC